MLPLENPQPVLLQIFYCPTFTDATVELVTTDGFLYPNQTLIEQGILNRKGFPVKDDIWKLLSTSWTASKMEDM